MDQLKLTASQKNAAARLELFWRIKLSGAGGLGGTATRPIPLLIGPSGAGKTAGVRDFVSRRDLPIFAINVTSWIVRGATCGSFTLDALAAFISQNGSGVIFLDEINKLRTSYLDVGNGWSMSVMNEIMALLDGDARLLQMGFSPEHLKALNERFFIVGAGAWQEVWTASTPRASLGFGGVQGGGDPDPAAFLRAVRDQNVIPEELLFRFNDRLILIEPPTVEEIASRICAIRSDAKVVPLSGEAVATLAREASDSHRAMRWLEAYAIEVIEELPSEWHIAAAASAGEKSSKVPPPPEQQKSGCPYPLLYASSFAIVKSLAGDLVQAAQDLSLRIAFEDVDQKESHKCRAFLSRLALHASSFTLPTISDLERLQHFDSLAEANDRIPAELGAYSFWKAVGAATRESHHRLHQIHFHLAKEVEVIRTILDHPELLQEKNIVDRRDSREEWFAKHKS
ncbi:MAG: AAA family ATPase [Verrucomicrobiae bacterium]